MNPQNQSLEKDKFLLEDGRIVNLKIFTLRIEEKERERIKSPYVLDLRKESKEKEPKADHIPNLLNLKIIPEVNQEKNLEILCPPPKEETKEEIFIIPKEEPSVFSPPESKKNLAPFPSSPLLLLERSLSALSATKIIPKKSFITFFILCLFFSSLISGIAFCQKLFNLKNSILSRVNVAYAELSEAQAHLGNQEYDLASSSFKHASNNFSRALSDAQTLGKVTMQALELAPLPTKIALGPRLLKTGEYIASTGEYLTLALKPFQNINPIYGEAGNEGLNLTQAFLEAYDNLKIALVNTERAEEEIQKIGDENLDKDLEEKITFLAQNIPLLKASLSNILSSNEDILEILGHNEPKRYLLLFQNNNEIRATGGFIGSYGILDLDEGRIKKLEINGIYDPDGQMLMKVAPPPPIRFVNTRWQTRDANWFPDFPTSARKTSWFFEKTGGPSVDGVIALTPPLMVELLKTTGPIPMPEYETTISADNFVMQTQREVEVEYNQEQNRPKQFLADLAVKVLDKILSTEKPEWTSLLKIFSQMAEEKHLLFYLFDDDLQEFILKNNWGGEMKKPSQDYLSVVNSNINGGKTDGMIKEVINLDITINSDGSIINEVEITRHHTGNYEWPSINNIDYLRLYVPEGSSLISASGFDKVNIPPSSYEEMQYERDPLLEEINKTSKTDEASGTVVTREFGKTCFGNWVAVKPQEIAKVRFKYQLPFKVRPDLLHDIDKYTILAQKQAGSLGSEFHFKLNLPSGLKMIWHYPEEVRESEERVITWDTILATDKYLGIALEKN